MRGCMDPNQMLHLSSRLPSHSMYGCMRSRLRSVSRSLMKKSVSSGLATHSMQQQSRVMASFPLAVNLSPTCSACRHACRFI